MSSPSMWMTNEITFKMGMTHFKFWASSDISETTEARVVKFYTHVDYIVS